MKACPYPCAPAVERAKPLAEVQPPRSRDLRTAVSELRLLVRAPSEALPTNNRADVVITCTAVLPSKATERAQHQNGNHVKIFM